MEIVTHIKEKLTKFYQKSNLYLDSIMIYNMPIPVSRNSMYSCDFEFKKNRVNEMNYEKPKVPVMLRLKRDISQRGLRFQWGQDIHQFAYQICKLSDAAKDYVLPKGFVNVEPNNVTILMLTEQIIQNVHLVKMFFIFVKTSCWKL